VYHIKGYRTVVLAACVLHEKVNGQLRPSGIEIHWVVGDESRRIVQPEEIMDIYQRPNTEYRFAGDKAIMHIHDLALTILLTPLAREAMNRFNPRPFKRNQWVPTPRTRVAYETPRVA